MIVVVITIIIITITPSLFPQMTPSVYSLYEQTWFYPNRTFSSGLNQDS